MKLLLFIIIIFLVAVALLFWINNDRVPTNLGVKEGKLSPCSSKPNCVSSQSTDSEHFIKPLNVKGIDHPFEKIKSIILSVPKTAVIDEQDRYLHATFRSKIFSFVDDVEFYYDQDNEVIHVRSAARLGYSDLGVNRKRVEWIRSKLEESH